MSNRQKYSFLLIAMAIAILIATMSPFKFIVPDNLSRQELIEQFYLFTHIKDYVRNIILFVPIGVAWAGITQQKEKRYGQIIGSAWLFGAVFSSNIEVIQILLPSRTSSISDIVCNSLGAFIGASFYCWRQDFSKLFSLTLCRQYRAIDLKFLSTIILIYCLTIIGTFALFFNSINFNNWNQKANLSIASEITGQIFWRGYINSLHICDRAITSSEIDRAFQNTHSFFSSLPNLVTSFIFLDYRPYYRDLTGNIADLHWHQDRPNKKIDYQPEAILDNTAIDNLIHNRKAVLFEKRNSLISSLPATQLTKKLQDSQEFTLSIILATNKLQQVGPSRIISLGENIYSRNFLLGQEGSKLIFRFRTPTTGANALQPSFFIPNFFQDTELHQILITFANNKVTIYLDRPTTKYSFSFQPATHLKLFSPWIIRHWGLDLTTYNLLQTQLIFYSLILSPLGIFISIYIIALSSKLRSHTHK